MSDSDTCDKAALARESAAEMALDLLPQILEDIQKADTPELREQYRQGRMSGPVGFDFLFPAPPAPPRQLPPNVIEISARCRDMRILGVLGPIDRLHLAHYQHRAWSDIPGRLRVLSSGVPEGAFCADVWGWWDPGGPQTVFDPPDGRFAVVTFSESADLSKIRIRLLVDGVPYEVNAAAPEEMQAVKALPEPERLLPETKSPATSHLGTTPSPTSLSNPVIPPKPPATSR